MDVLFLDIDYVLNSDQYERLQFAQNKPFVPYYSEIDPRCISLLNQVLEALPSLKIVISSSWRDSLSLAEFQKLFTHFNLNREIIDTTSSDMTKADSIRLWVKENKPKKFIILDDDSLFDLKDSLYKNFYKVSTASLQPSDVDKIVNQFKKLS